MIDGNHLNCMKGLMVGRHVLLRCYGKDIKTLSFFLPLLNDLYHIFVPFKSLEQTHKCQQTVKYFFNMHHDHSNCISLYLNYK